MTSPQRAPETLVRDVRVFDGGQVIGADAVLLRDGLIAEVGSDVTSPAVADVVVEGAGGMLLPGFIDAHTHVLQPAELTQALAFGVTTELDMFCVPSLLGPLRRAAANRADVADLYSSGIGATVPGGHPTQLVDMGIYPSFPTMEDAGDAAGFVADRVSEGSDWLKILIEDGSTMGWGGQPRLDPAAVAAVTAAGHAAGLQVVAHISTQADAAECVAAGVDGLAHLFVDRPPESAFVDRAAGADVFAIPTITILEALYRPAGDRRELHWVDHPRMWPYLSQAMQQALLTDWREQMPWQPPDWASTSHTRQATRQLHQAGVPILAGTDVAYPRAAHGLSLHAELAALVDAGLSPVAALAAATSTPADRFRLGDRGRIKPGLRADLLLVDGDPTHDITATGEITHIWRGGHHLDRDAYQATLHTPDVQSNPSH